MTTQAKHFSCFQGIKVTPSGRLPSFLSRSTGSFDAGIMARLVPRQMTSLTALCLETRPALLRHDSPCVPRHSTILPQGQSCIAQSAVPSHRPFANLIVSFGMRSLIAVVGGAKSQSPPCQVQTALSLALFYYYYYYLLLLLFFFFFFFFLAPASTKPAG